MIGYGLAFVIGWLFILVHTGVKNEQFYPWDLKAIAWGLIFMGLNWIASL